MAHRTPVQDGDNNTRWYDAESLLHDFDDRHGPDQSRGSRLRMTRHGVWVLSQWSNWEGENPPDKTISPAEAHHWLSGCDPMYEPADLGLQGPAYAAFLEEQET